MRAGQLDRRIAILTVEPAVDDGMRSKPGGWAEIAKRWAALTPLTGAERVVAAENAAVETLKFRVRRDSLTVVIKPGTHRIAYLELPYDIEAKLEYGRDGFELLVTGRSDGGEQSE
jgi:head-tail adaptor